MATYSVRSPGSVAYATDIPSFAEARRALREARRVGQADARLYCHEGGRTKEIDEDGYERVLVEEGDDSYDWQRG